MLTVNLMSGTIRMYGLVGRGFGDEIHPEHMARALGELDGRDIEMHITSDGGDVFDGISIVNQMRSYPGRINVVVDGIAASIASVIAVNGSSTQIFSNSMMMIHNPFTGLSGDAGEFRAAAELLDKIGEQIARSYYAQSGGKTSVAEFMELMNDKEFMGDLVIAVFFLALFLYSKWRYQ